MSRVEIMLKPKPAEETAPSPEPQPPSEPKPPVDREGVELLLKRLGKTKYLILPTYEFHRRGKNWIAKITALDPKYKFKREFLKITTVDKSKVIEEDQILDARFLQFYSMYFSSRGRESWDDEKRRWNGYWRIVLVDVYGCWALKTTEREIIEYFSATS